MTDFDEEVLNQEQQQQQQQLHQMKSQFHQVMGELQHLRNVVANNIPRSQNIPPPQNRPNLNLFQPPFFSGNPL